MTLVNVRESYPATIGGLTMYCEKMTLSAKTTVQQAPTVVGIPVQTNKFRHFTYITFTGRVYDPSNPMFLIFYANNINGTENVEAVYRGLKFPRCIVTGIEAEDSGEDYIKLTVSLATATTIAFA